MKKNMSYIGITILVIFSLLGYGIYYRLNKEDKSDDKKPKTEKIKAVVKVETVIAKHKDLVMEINTTGTARAIKKIKITPKIGGDIKKVVVHENSYVNKNDLLFTIDDEKYQLNLADAANQLTTSKIEYGIRKKQDKSKNKIIQESPVKVEELLKKLKENYKNNTISKKEYEKQELELEVKELFLLNNRDKILKNASGLSNSLINYKKAKIDLDNTIINAPFSGYIANQDIIENETINSGQSCMELVDISTIKMEIPVLESEISDLKEDRISTIKFDAFPNKVFTGKIKHISPIVDETTKTCKVIVHIDNSELLIKPGMNGDVTIEGRIYPKLLLVPKEAVISRDNRKLLFVVENGKAKWIYIKTGRDNFEFVEIKNKLKIGQEVVVSNNYTLAHDASVKITKKKEY